MWDLGKWLRKRYRHFLSWDVREVSARSSPRSRCFDSAAILLYGMYPAHGVQRKWNPRQDWQPVMITNLPDGTDKYSTLCSKRLLKTADALSALKVPPSLAPKPPVFGKKHTEVFATAGDVIAYGARMTNVTDVTGLKYFVTMMRVFDALFVMREYGLRLPEWALRHLHVLDWVNQMMIEWIARFQMEHMAGLMLKDIVVKLRSREPERLSLTQEKDDTTPSHKITLLAYHDTNIAGVVLGLNNTLSAKPPYGSAIILEAFTESADTTRQLYVRILYKAGNKLTNLVIEGCHEPCAIEKFDEFLHQKYELVSREQCDWSEHQPLL